MKGIRRKEKAIETPNEMKDVIEKAAYITIAMCKDNVPYLVTLSHGYDPDQNCIFFHCAKEGKKIDYLKENNVVWGQALIDKGYVQGACDHLYIATQFKGKVSFINDFEEKKQALIKMINKLDDSPKQVIDQQLSEKSISSVNIGRIDIEYMSGKKAKDVVISL
ncbi:MAG: pyridoxamine 5'-phosphate oxidase family protein [Candidatus Thorarchaeota archaeon]